MNSIKRTLSVAMTLVMCIVTIVGCGTGGQDIDLSDEIITSTYTTVTGGEGQTVTGGQTTTVPGTVGGGTGSNVKDPLSVDLKGAEIVIYGMSAPNASSSKTEAAKAEMFEKIEKKMNCKVKFVESSTENTRHQALLNVMSNTYFADIVQVTQVDVVSFLTSDLVYNLDKVSTVGLGDSYMNIAGGVDAWYLSGGHWAVCEPIHTARTGNYVFFNKRIMKEITGDEDYPYTLMKNKQWNVSNYRSLAKKAVKELDGNSTMTEADRWGIIQIDVGTFGAGALLQAVGAQMVVNNNGVLSYNMEDSKVMSAMNLAYDLYVKDGNCLRLGDDAARKAFASGHSLFLGSYLGSIDRIADMKDDFGVLPYPMGDSAKDYSVASNWCSYALLLPSSLDSARAKTAGAFLQAYCYLAQDVVETMYDEYTLRYCRDEKSTESMWIGLNSQVTTAANAVCGDASIKMGTYRVLNDLCASGADPATGIAANKGISITALKDLNDRLSKLK